MEVHRSRPKVAGELSVMERDGVVQDGLFIPYPHPRGEITMAIIQS